VDVPEIGIGLAGAGLNAYGSDGRYAEKYHGSQDN